MNQPNKPFFYQGIVLDNEDPLMLGRIRSRLITDSYNDVIASITNPVWNEQKDKWTSRDPFLFSPLLPYFVYQVPKKDELIYAFYYNNDYKYQNQFYVQAMFSSPTLSSFEYYIGAQKHTGLGGQYTNPLPLKNQDGTYASKMNEGVFPEPGDNALLGRGSADLIIKQDEVLLRAGKTIGNLIPNTIPAANNTRAFVQLSRFNNIKILDDVKTFTQQFEQIVTVKYLIEWVITNPENTQDKFTGNVYLYKLKPNIKTNSKELKVDSNVDEYKSLILSWGFNALSMVETIKFINDFIITCNNEGNINGKKVFKESPFPIFYRPTNSTYSFINSSTVSPLNVPVSDYWCYGSYFFLVGSGNVDIKVINKTTGVITIAKSTSCTSCTANSDLDRLYTETLAQVKTELQSLNIENVLLPAKSDLIDLSTGTIPTAPPTPTVILPSNSTAQLNLSKIYNGIKLNNTTVVKGYGLIYTKDKVGFPFDVKSTDVPIFKYNNSAVTFGALGADKICLLSHLSSIPGKGKINFDGTLYGITNDKYTDEIEPKTSSLVRGEELLELINLIVRFLTTHTHAYPGLPPVPVTQDGSSVSTLLSEMQNAVNKVLNQNIRLN